MHTTPIYPLHAVTAAIINMIMGIIAPIPSSARPKMLAQPISISVSVAVPRFCLTYTTKSSSTPGHAPSSLHQLIVSSSLDLTMKLCVWSHMSLLILFVHFSSKYSIHQSSHGVEEVFQESEGGVKSRRQYSIATSSGRTLWPCCRAKINVCL